MVEIKEPGIRKEDILILEDSDFNEANVCIVTGAASGIGRAAAVALSVNGITVAGVDINETGALETIRVAEGLGGRVNFIQADLTKDEDIERSVREASGMGSVKYLANIAGVQHIDSVDNFPMEKYDFMQSLMLRAPFYLSKLVIRQIKNSASRTGAIGNMASIHAHVSTINKPAYNTVKFGLRGLTQSIAAEGEGRIRAFTISTGFVKTQLALNQVAAQAQQRGITPDEVVRDVMMGPSRVKEMMAPIDAGNLFVYGFSRFARYLVGGDLLFDGGLVLTY